MSSNGQASRIQERTISHTGQEVEPENVTLSQNQVSPQRKSSVIAWECPAKYDEIRYAGRRHFTKMELRTLEEVTADGSATYGLSTRLQPVGGEEEVDEQPIPAVVAYDVTADAELEVESINYATDEVTLASSPADGNDLKFYPCLSEGEVQIQGVNQFGQVEGPADRWQTPVYRWLDFDQDKRGTEVNLQGSIRFGRYESIELTVDSPQQVVWEDADYPRDSFVSNVQQRVDVVLG